MFNREGLWQFPDWLKILLRGPRGENNYLSCSSYEVDKFKLIFSRHVEVNLAAQRNSLLCHHPYGKLYGMNLTGIPVIV